MLSLEWPHQKQSNSLALSPRSKEVGTRCRGPSYERFLEGCSSLFMRLAEYLIAVCAWCKQWPPGWQAMAAWLVKTRRAPSRHSRDARVYGHTATAMHKLSTPPHPPYRRTPPHSLAVPPLLPPSSPPPLPLPPLDPQTPKAQTRKKQVRSARRVPPAPTRCTR